MKFILRESVEDSLIFRGVGNNINNSNEYLGGRFFASDVDDAGNYGDTILVYELYNSSKLYKGESSLDYCEENGLMNSPHPFIKRLTNGAYNTLAEAEEDLIWNGENPNLYYALVQYVAKEQLSNKGYLGAHWRYEDDLVPEQYQIWDESIVKMIDKLSYDDAVHKY